MAKQRLQPFATAGQTRLNGSSRPFSANQSSRWERLFLLRVIRCLPVSWQCGALRGQASDKPQGRKPRAGLGTTVPRVRAMGIWGPRALG